MTTTESVKLPCRLSAIAIQILVWVCWTILFLAFVAILYSCNHQTVIAFQRNAEYPLSP